MGRKEKIHIIDIYGFEFILITSCKFFRISAVRKSGSGISIEGGQVSKNGKTNWITLSSDKFYQIKKVLKDF